MRELKPLLHLDCVTVTGDTLSAKGSGVVFPAINFPLPSISFAIEPKTRADEDECIRFFGAEYRDYMKRTKRFVPFVF